MLKILLIPEAEYLTEFDIGLHLDDLERVDQERQKVVTIGYGWRGPKKPNITYKKYSETLDKLNEKRIEIIDRAKTKLALVNNETKAKKAIQYYRALTDDKYVSCEFEIRRAKK